MHFVSLSIALRPLVHVNELCFQVEACWRSGGVDCADELRLRSFQLHGCRALVAKREKRQQAASDHSLAQIYEGTGRGLGQKIGKHLYDKGSIDQYSSETYHFTEVNLCVATNKMV